MNENKTNFFADSEIGEDVRRDIAFQVLVAGRDLLQIADKKTIKPTYENSLGLLNELAPELYETFVKLLSRKNESELVQYFRDLAESESKRQEKEVTPIELIDLEIERMKGMYGDSRKRTFLKRLTEHLVAREKLQPVRLTENRILNRDFGRIDRSSYANLHFKDDFYNDYILRNKNILRVRFLHPDPDEHVSGADLIYEQYDLATKKVRFVFLQYKTWEKDTIYKSQAANLEPQMNKIATMLCNNNLCHSIHGVNTPHSYRMPYCAGFLRPTDKIQQGDNKMMSTGYHLPVCSALNLLETDGKINKKTIAEQSFKSHIFEELFNTNMIGSRWIDVAELEKLYEKHNMFLKSDRITLYALELLNEESQMISD